MIPVVGQRVRVAKDFRAEESRRVPPMVGHCGTITELGTGVFVGRVRISFDHHEPAWFHETELELLP